MSETELEPSVATTIATEAIREAELVVDIHSLREQIRIVAQIHADLLAKLAGIAERTKELKAERQAERTFATYRNVNSARKTMAGLHPVSDVIRAELDRLKQRLAELEDLRRPALEAEVAEAPEDAQF